MFDRFDIINSPDFFRQFIEKKYLAESLYPEFREEFPTFNSYLYNAKLIMHAARDQYVEKFYDMSITDVKYIVETMLNFSNIDLNFNIKVLTELSTSEEINYDC